MAQEQLATWLVLDADNAAAPYYFYYPWMAQDSIIQADLLAKVTTNHPAVIVYRRHDAIAGIVGWSLAEFAPELTAWLDANYALLAGYDDVYIRNDN